MNGRTDNNLARSRAQFAYDAVEKWSASWRKEALPLVRGLPVQVRTQGLPVTLATLLRGDSIPAKRLAEMIGHWLLVEAPHRPLRDTESPTRGPAQRLLALCLAAERSAYLAAQAEALALLEQVKLFADALAADWEERDG